MLKSCRSRCLLCAIDVFSPAFLRTMQSPAYGACRVGIARMKFRAGRWDRLRNRFIYIDEEVVMGKFFIAWLLGVPLVVLVLIYLIF